MGEGTIKGQLVDIGPFPGLIGHNGQNSRVQGEVYLVDNETLARLDRLEGEGSLYLRKSVVAQMTSNCKGDGQKAKVVWTYFWNGNQDLPIVPTGNWQK